jgi:hypothetical protein
MFYEKVCFSSHEYVAISIELKLDFTILKKLLGIL